jgi:predicted Zn finger-like uncharacterized protein
MTMVIECDACHSRFRLDKGLFRGSKAIRVRCRKCGGSIAVRNPDLPPPAAAPDAPPPIAARPPPPPELPTGELPFPAPSPQELPPPDLSLPELSLPDPPPEPPPPEPPPPEPPAPPDTPPKSPSPLLADRGTEHEPFTSVLDRLLSELSADAASAEPPPQSPAEPGPPAPSVPDPAANDAQVSAVLDRLLSEYRGTPAPAPAPPKPPGESAVPSERAMPPEAPRRDVRDAEAEHARINALTGALDALDETEVPHRPQSDPAAEPGPFPGGEDRMGASPPVAEDSAALASALDELFRDGSVSPPADFGPEAELPQAPRMPQPPASAPWRPPPLERPPYTRPAFLAGAALWLLLLAGGALYFGTGGSVIGWIASGGKGQAARAAFEVRNVTWNYEPKTDAGELLVVRGSVVNVGAASHGAVLVRGTLVGKDNAALAETMVIAGNTVDDTTIRHAARNVLEGELEKPPNEAQLDRGLPNGGSLPFTMIFFRPPQAVDSIVVRSDRAP